MNEERRGLTFRDLRNAIIFGLLVFLAVVFFRDIAEIILVFTIIILLVVIFSPIVTWLNRHRIPRWGGTAIVVLVGLGILGGILYFVIPVAVSQFSDFVALLPSLVDKIEKRYDAFISKYPSIRRALAQYSITEILASITRSFVGSIGRLASDVIYLIAAVIVIFISTIYGLVNPQPLIDGFLNVFTRETRPRAAAAGVRFAVQIWAWAKGTLFAMATIFVLTWIALYFLGFKQALLFAVIAGVLEIVPIIGPILSGVPPVLAALVREPILAVWVIAVYFGIQEFEAHVLIPLVMSHQVRLHPITIIFTVLVMGLLFGLVGIFLATPTAVAAGVLYDELYVCQYRKRCEQIPISDEEEEEENRRIKREAQRVGYEQMEMRLRTRPSEQQRTDRSQDQQDR